MANIKIYPLGLSILLTLTVGGKIVTSVHSRLRKRDIFSNLVYENNSTVSTERYGHFKQILKHKQGLRCPRDLKLEKPWKIRLQMNSMGYQILTPNKTELVHLSLLIKRQASKTVQDENNDQVLILDRQCTKRNELLETVRLYGGEEKVQQALETYSVKDLSAKIIQTIHEIIAVQRLCNFTAKEMDGTLDKYILAATGVELNECQIKICVMNPHLAEEQYLLVLGVILGTSTAIYFWYCIFNGKLNVRRQRNCLKFGQNVVDYSPRIPAPVGIHLKNRIKQLEKQTGPNQESISLYTDSDSTEIHQRDFEVLRIRSKTTVQRNSAVFGLISFILAIFYISASLTQDEELQHNLCTAIDKIRTYIL